MNNMPTKPAPTSTKPLVSLCMATCLRADLFPESFAGLLRQAYAPLEIIVLVDGANEDSIKVIEAAKDPRVRYITTPKPSGMVPAWNRVVREVRGKYFLFCADDDVLQERAVDNQVGLMEANPTVGFCHADWRSIDDDGKIIGEWYSHEGNFIKPGAYEWPRYLIRTGCCMQTVLVRTSTWSEVGGWDDDAGHPGDNSLYLKLLRVSDVGHVAHVSCHYRIRTRKPDSWAKRFKNIQEYWSLAQKHLQSPPSAFQEIVPWLTGRLCAHWSLASIDLLHLAAPGQRQEFTAWAEKTIWTQSAAGRCCRWLARFGLEGLAHHYAKKRLQFRRWGKGVMAGWRGRKAAGSLGAGQVCLDR